jgi:cation transport protein ChaC
MNEHQLVFAYGSLVNRHTRQNGVEAIPARLHGWVREWKHCVNTDHGGVCALTVTPDPAIEIRGVVLLWETARMKELDEREIGYSQVRVKVSLDVSTGRSQEADCILYVGRSDYYLPGSREFPIWRSYLDCILSGYLELGGRQAVEEFIASTRGWDTPILDDRQKPRYFRAVTLTSDQQSQIDEILEQHEIPSFFSDSPIY